MLPENLRDRAVAAAVEAFDSDAVTTGKFDQGRADARNRAGEDRQRLRLPEVRPEVHPVEQVTAVDRYPSEPRFEVVYHLHSIERNERLRLKCRLRGDDPAIESVTSVWRGANWYEREVFDLFGIQFHRPSRPAADHDARRLGRPSAAQGLPGHGDEGLGHERIGHSGGHDRGRRGGTDAASRTAPHGPQHGAAASVHPRRAAPADGTRRRDHHEVPRRISATCTPASRRNSRSRPTSRR